MIGLKNKKIIIATHVFATGPAQELKEYLLQKKIGKLLFIGHPLFFEKRLKGSGYELYKNGILLTKKYSKIRRIPLIISFLKDLLLNIFWVIKQGRQWNLYVGSDNLNALCGVILKRLGFVKRVVYYVIDYHPERFENKLLNRVYHTIDKYCIRFSDETWNLSPRMKEGRKAYFGLDPKIYHRQKWVPMGAWVKRVRRNKSKNFNRYTLVFLGHLIEKQGIQEILQTIPLIVRKIPKFKFIIIGTGYYEKELKKIVDSLNIEKYVTFLGFIEDHMKVEKIISSCAIGIAMYNKKESFSYYADPGKIKNYIACGLPVILTDVPYIAREIEKRNCGKIIDYDKYSIAAAVIQLMQNTKLFEEYRKSAIEFAKQFDWNLIFENALKKVIR